MVKNLDYGIMAIKFQEKYNECVIRPLATLCVTSQIGQVVDLLKSDVWFLKTSKKSQRSGSGDIYFYLENLNDFVFIHEVSKLTAINAEEPFQIKVHMCL